VTFPETPYSGLLLIGDPHLEGRVPGFRKDDYPRTILEKLRWCLGYASDNRLLPAVLGDLFHLPRDNPNWLLVELMQLFDGELLAVYGNHDVHENELNEDDSLSILVHAGSLRLLSEENPFTGEIGGRPVIVGGTSWGRPLPRSFELSSPDSGDLRRLVFWLVHHDLILPGYEEAGRLRPRGLPGIDVVINGHIHRRLDEYHAGSTLWMTPGNISRRARSDATREHVPSVLRIDIERDRWDYRYITVPHEPFDAVFHESVIEETPEEGPSAFISGLAELEARRTETGAGLEAFLEQNMEQFDHEVAEQIRTLAKEVTHA